LTAAEAESIADSIDQRYRALVLVSAFGALRFGEAAGLRKRDVGLRKLRIHGSVVQVGSKVERVERTKTEDSLREVSVPASVMEELARHITELGVEDDDALLFPAPNGGPLSRTLFRSRVWVPACERAGLAVAERSPSGSFRGWKVRPPRFHDLRHTGVALAIKAGAHPRTIQTWVGHSSISTTMNIYGHLYDEAHEELASGLDAERVAALASREVTDVIAFGGRHGQP
jgi:integrase